MQIRFVQHLNNKFPFLEGKRILLAISGGLDSTVLAHLCQRAGLDVAWAHCNFRLRGKESDEDENFVKILAKKLEQQVFIQAFDTEKFAIENRMSIQIAARELRYNWFRELSEKHGFDYIFTAHHANDSFETFLINTIRGTGLEGLTGIPAQKGKVIRPLLLFSREEICNYAENEGFSWREDSSNASTKYLRNKIRHQVVPVLESENPHLIKSFLKTQEHLQETSDLLQDYTNLLVKEIVEIKEGDLHYDIQEIQTKPNPNAVLYQLLKAYNFTAWEDIYGLLTAQSGKIVHSPTHRLLKNRGELILSEIDSDKTTDDEIEIRAGVGHIAFPLGKLDLKETDDFKKVDRNTIFVDKKAIKFPLTVRKWKESDYFYPFGMKGKKKVSNYLKDEKLSLFEKENIWLLVSEEKIVWVIGYRADERFRVGQKAADIMALHFSK